MQFATMLKQRRTELQMTQQEMADRLFVTRQTVSRWENNLSYPNLDTLVEISNLLNLSLDSLLKGEMDVVSKISSDVRAKGRYKKYALIVTSILALIVTALLLLSYGRATQNQLIDRINPFLVTQVGYGVLPIKNKSEFDTFISDDPFGNGEWLKFKTGKYTNQNRWVVVAHKGSYVSNVRTITSKDIPTGFKEQVGNRYFRYSKKTMGPRVSKKWSLSPFR